MAGKPESLAHILEMLDCLDASIEVRVRVLEGWGVDLTGWDLPDARMAAEDYRAELDEVLRPAAELTQRATRLQRVARRELVVGLSQTD